MDKSELIRRMLEWRNSATYNIFSQKVMQEFIRYTLNNDNKMSFAIPSLTLIDNSELTLTDFFTANDSDLLQIKRQANIFVTSNWFKESFRLLQSYSYNNKKDKELKQQDWYEFTRLTVNAISHDYKYQFGKKDLKLLPVKYVNNVIALDMQGKAPEVTLQYN